MTKSVVLMFVCVRGCVGKFALDVFLDTANTFLHDNCLTILWYKRKIEQKQYILDFLQIT